MEHPDATIGMRTALKYALIGLIISLLMSLLRSTRILLNKPAVARLNTFQRSRLPQARKMHIQSLPMWEGTGNNYAYLITDGSTKASVIIDPANPKEVLPTLQEQAQNSSIELVSIINTHHHPDHSGGNAEISKAFPGLPLIAGKDSPGVTHTPKHGDKWSIGKDLRVTALHTPCHTQDSICYYVEDQASGDKAVFTGDTLFIGGCGRFFEGTAEEMDAALNKVLGALPDDTKVFPGHEYTKGNIKFAVTVSNKDGVAKLKDYAEKNKVTTGKFTIGDEKKHNVFMMLEDEEIVKATGAKDRVAVMAKLREMKNSM